MMWNYSVAEREKIMAAARHADELLPMELLFFCEISGDCLLRLKIADVDLGEGTIRVPTRNTAMRTCYLNESLHAQLERHVTSLNSNDGERNLLFAGYDLQNLVQVVKDAGFSVRPFGSSINNTLPMPPEHLRFRVHGADDKESFNLLGEAVSEHILEEINLAGIVFNDKSRILDFGCGSARILRWLPELYENCKMYGVDIDDEAIRWCQQNLSHICDFSTNTHLPPLGFSNDFFDFVYSISIFTHLPEEMQLAWLEELMRVIKPGGYLFLTVHGKKHLKHIPEADQLLATGFAYAKGNGTKGLPDFYQNSFHTLGYIEKKWSEYFEICKVVEQGLAANQDIVICKKR